MAKPPSKEPTFKERLDQLTRLVEALESGDLGLEDAITRFEEGKTLHQTLAQELEGYERRLERLTKAGRETVAEPSATEVDRG